jgi:hypothetical protein
MAVATELHICCPLEPSDQGSVQISICGPMDARSVNRVRRVMRPLLDEGVRHVDTTSVALPRWSLRRSLR